MWEMINNAREGFLSMHTYGKYVALLVILLCYLWCRKYGYTISRKQYRKPEKHLLLYTTVLTVLCSLPVTAVVLMKYQTAFYDYPWVWALVPMTIMLAYGGTLLLEDALQSERLKKNWQKALFTVAIVLLFIMAGGMGSREEALSVQQKEYRTTESILEVLTSDAAISDETGDAGSINGSELCIWAPTMVLEYVRMIEPDAQVAYGRNMWDLALNAFTYDTYGEEETALYEAMCEAEHRARFQDLRILDLAAQQGITHLILPGYVLRADVDAAAAYLGTEVLQAEGYFVIALAGDTEK